MNNKKRVHKLWHKDPHCHWCGTETVLRQRDGFGRMHPTDATLDHLFPKYHPLKGKTIRGEEVTVLACYKCNNERGNTYMQEKKLEGLELNAVEKLFEPKREHRPLWRHPIWLAFTFVVD